MNGMLVKIKWTTGDTPNEYHNVTLVHYKYPSALGQKVAFESDIHGTGATFPIDKIAEMEIMPEESIAICF